MEQFIPPPKFFIFNKYSMYSEKQHFSLVHNLKHALSSVRHSTCTSCCILMSLVNFYEVKYSTTGWRESAFTETHAYLKFIPEVWNERGRSESCSNLTVPWNAIRKQHVRKKRASVREQRNDKQTDIAWDCYQQTELDERKIGWKHTEEVQVNWITSPICSNCEVNIKRSGDQLPVSALKYSNS